MRWRREEIKVATRAKPGCNGRKAFHGETLLPKELAEHVYSANRAHRIHSADGPSCAVARETPRPRMEWRGVFAHFCVALAESLTRSPFSNREFRSSCQQLPRFLGHTGTSLSQWMSSREMFPVERKGYR